MDETKKQPGTTAEIVARDLKILAANLEELLSPLLMQTLNQAAELLEEQSNLQPYVNAEIARLQKERDAALNSQNSLYEMIRTSSNEEDLRDLQRYVGPSKSEIEASKMRLKHIDQLDPHCEWDCLNPSCKAQQYRERRQRIMSIQTNFENKYY